MKKLKQQHNITLIHCNLFLQNNFNKINSKQILYKNQNLLINKQFNMIEFQHIKNINIAALTSISKFNNIVSIQSQYNNKFLFNYTMNYQIHNLFHKIICCNAYQRTNKLLRGRILGRKNYKHTKLYVAIFGIVYILRSKNLLLFLHHLVTNKYIPMQYLKDQTENKSKSKKNIPNYLRKLQFAKKLINKYMLKPILFKVKLITQDKFIISRRAFIKYLFAQQRIIRRNHALILKEKQLKLQKFKILVEKYKKKKTLKKFFKKLQAIENKKINTQISSKQRLNILNQKEAERLKKEAKKKYEEERLKKEAEKLKRDIEKKNKKIEKKKRKQLRLKLEEELKLTDLTKRSSDLLKVEEDDDKSIPIYLKKPLTANEILFKKNELRKNYNLLIQQKKLFEKDEIKRKAALQKKKKNQKKISPEEAKERFIHEVKRNKLLDRKKKLMESEDDDDDEEEPRPLNELGNPINFAVDFITPMVNPIDNLLDPFVIQYQKKRQKQLQKMRKDFKFYQNFKVEHANKHQRRRNRKKENMRIMRKRNGLIFDDINTKIKNVDDKNNPFII